MSGGSSSPSRRKVSVSTLVYSTLGPSLALLPNEDRTEGDWIVLEDSSNPAAAGPEERDVQSHIGSGKEGKSIVRPQGPNHCGGGGDIEPSSGISGPVDQAEKRNSTTKLGFRTKSGAGITSSSQQATLPRQNCEASTEGAISPVTSKLKLISKNSMDGTEPSIEEAPLQSSNSENPDSIPRASSTGGSGGSGTTSNLIPRAATASGGGWSRPGRTSQETVGLTEILQDLDRHAGEKQHRERVSSLQNDSMVGVPLSWKENAISNRHLWHQVDSREACHLAETQYCQQLKLFHPRRHKVRCTACKCVVHDTCIKQLYYEGYCCKDTFREIKQKVKETATCHHFLHRRKAVGRCQKCDRGFGNWRKFDGRSIVGVSCSFCGDSYHVACFSDSLKKESCHMGPLRNIIIPPSWIVKLPAVEQNSTGTSFSGTGDAHISPKGSTRRKTRRSRRKKVDERASKYYTVKPMALRQHKPLLVFINPKSGGNQGARLLQTFQWFLNPRQVFDLSQGGPEFGLKMYQGVANLRILACGGDGTAGWIFSILDKLDIRPPPPLALLPLGTGNDLARVFNWGGGYTDEPIEKILLHVDEGPVEEMDRWMINVWKNPQVQASEMSENDGVSDAPLHVINNYFSIGADAQVALDFHNDREANPEKFNKRYRNKMQYGILAAQDLFQRKFQCLTDHITLYGDGEDLTEKIRTLRLEAICFLNITSYGAGSNPWGNPSSRDPQFTQQLLDDGKIEIVGFWSSTFPKLKVGLAHGERIAQCEHIKLVTTKSFPIQIDGEACKLLPSIIEVGLKNKAMLVRKIARRYSEAPLRGVRPSDRIKLSVSKVTNDQYDRLHSDLHEIRKIAIPLGFVVATPQDTLKAMRKQIEQFAQDKDEELPKSWRFLDVANSGRIDRLFQVIPDQEGSILIGEMLSDGLLVVEMPSSPPSTPLISTRPAILLSPDTEEGVISGNPLKEKRKQQFGRNASYERATNHSLDRGMSPPFTTSGLEVPPNPNLHSAESSPSDTPVPSDDELCLLINPLPDTGSDSAGTDTDVANAAGLQKALLDSVKRGNVKKVMEYHGKGAQLTLTDSNGWTPLHHAARLDKKQVVQYIIDHIPREALDIVEDEKLQTPLHKAAWYGHVEVSKMLVKKGASLARCDYQGNSVYEKSMQSGNKELQKFINGQMTESKKFSTEEEIAI